MRHGLSTVLLVAGAVGAGAQAPGAIEGAVYDSLRGAPLVGALVAADGTPRAARTDAAGRFALDSLPPGRYTLVVESEALDSLGAAVPPAAIEVGAGERRTVRLAVPSAATLIGLVCPAAAAAASDSGDGGVLIGVVRDAAALAPVAGASVEVRWDVWTFPDGKMARVRASVVAVTGVDGTFAACGLPPGTNFAVRARGRARASGEVPARVADHGLGRRDLMIGAPGEGAVRGSVLFLTGQPAHGARISVAGDSGFATSDSIGEFRLDHLPSGSQLLVVRRVGFPERRADVESRAGVVTPVVVRLEEALAHVLNRVIVAGRAGSPAGDAAGFTGRRQMGIGRFLDRRAIDAHGVVPVPELLRGIPGIAVYMTDSGAVAVWVRSARNCFPAYYLDGMQVEGSQTGRSNQVEAIEVYPPGEAPPRYGGARGTCAVILLWTPRPTTLRAAPESKPESTTAPP